MAAGVAIVAYAGWLKADDNSLPVFGLFLAGVVVCIAGVIVLAFGDRNDPWLRWMRNRADDDRGSTSARDDE